MNSIFYDTLKNMYNTSAVITIAVGLNAARAKIIGMHGDMVTIALLDDHSDQKLTMHWTNVQLIGQ